MFVPEDMAFTLYCRLLDAPPAGAGLRRLYEPGLESLKCGLGTGMCVPIRNRWWGCCGMPVQAGPRGCVGTARRRLTPPANPTIARVELATFELLLAKHMPDLHVHMQAAGLPAVL